MSKKQTVIDAVCAQQQQMRVIIALLIAMTLLLLFSLLTVRPGDRTFPLVVINAVMIVITFTFFVTTYWYCAKREVENRESVRE